MFEVRAHHRSAMRIGGQTKPEELDWLHDQAKQVRSWIEVGSYCGRSAFAVAVSLPKNGRLTLVEATLEHIDAGSTLLRTFQQICHQCPDLEVVLAKTTSVRAARFVKAANMVFIDAMHDQQSVAADIEAWKDKGRLCGHDYNLPGVRAALDASGLSVSNPVGSIWVQD